MKTLNLVLFFLIAAAAVTACTESVLPDMTAVRSTNTGASVATQPAATALSRGNVDDSEQEHAQPEVGATDPPPAETPTPKDPPAAVVLPLLGPAPEWQNDVWINTEGPLHLADLRGKVVLLEFWTFG